MNEASAVRAHVLALLQGGQAFETWEQIVDSIPEDRRAEIPAGAGHSAWQILEHMRIAQRDILDFTRDPVGYEQPDWPDDYWPRQQGPSEPDGWEKTQAAFLADRAEIEALVRNPESDLCAPLPGGDGQTLLREALLAADHAAYHLGELVMLQRLLQ